MKQLTLALISLFLFGAQAKSQNIKEIFKAMPAEMTPLLTANDKADFIDFMDSKMDAKVQNLLGGTSLMTRLSSDYLYVQMTKNSSLQMKLLPYKETYLIALINTVYGPARDSKLHVYNANWEKFVGEPLFTKPKLDDFFKLDLFLADKSNSKLADLRAVDVSLVELSFDADNLNIEVELHSLGYLDKELRDKLMPFFTKELMYTWKDNHFELQSKSE